MKPLNKQLQATITIITTTTKEIKRCGCRRKKKKKKRGLFDLRARMLKKICLWFQIFKKILFVSKEITIYRLLCYSSLSFIVREDIYEQKCKRKRMRIKKIKITTTTTKTFDFFCENT